jgi:hypothetical protein
VANQASFELAALTPIFNAGANRVTPELLRVASLKGALLYWFRALVGALCPLDQLRRLETVYFGGPQRAGDLRLALSGPLPDGRYPLKPYDRQERRWRPLEGFRYLAYGLEGRPFYDPDRGASFQLSVRCDRGETWEVAWCCLWLLSRFGGVGARTRRGMGGFLLRPAAGGPRFQGLPELSPRVWGTAEDLAADLSEGLNQVAGCLARHAEGVVLRFAWRTTMTAASSSSATRYPAFSSLVPGFWRARIIPLDAQGWEAALDAVGLIYQRWRHPPIPGKPRPLSKDFGVASGYVGSGSASGSRLAAFGLPLLFSFHSGTHAGARVGVRETGRLRTEDSRRASPLFLRVLRSDGADGKFFALAHVFKAKFVRDSTDRLEFYMKAAPGTGSMQSPSAPFAVHWTEVDSFLDSLTGPEVYVS